MIISMHCQRLIPNKYLIDGKSTKKWSMMEERIKENVYDVLSEKAIMDPS